MSPVDPHTGKTYDVAVVGSGMAGAILASILARQGASVLILDARVHPREAAGEVVTPRAATALRALAVRYGVPEIKALTTYHNASQIINCMFGERRHFGFMLHGEGRSQDPRSTTQASNGPLDAPPNLYRQDSDAFLFHTAVGYGCDVRQNYRIQGVEADGSGVTLQGADGSAYRARYVVDAAGRQAPVAAAFGLREETPRFKHRSRSQWTHILGVRDTDKVYAGRRPADTPPVPWHAGAMGHLFAGGWISVVPLGNASGSRNPRTGVTLTLDENRHPASGDLDAAQEFAAWTSRFPDLARQFEGSRQVREWTVAAPVQYSSTEVAGDRWFLLGDSAGFVDSLFARDLSDTAEVINVLAWRLLAAVKDDDFSAERFSYPARLQQSLLDYDDQLIDSAYSAFSSFPLWNAVFRIWAWGSGAGTFRLQEAMTRFAGDGRHDHFVALEDAPYPGFLWPEHEGFKKLFEEMTTRCAAYENGLLDGQEAAHELYRAIKESDFIPRHLGFAEPETRFLHATPRAIVKSLRWASSNADPELRRLLKGSVKQVVRSKLRMGAL